MAMLPTHIFCELAPDEVSDELTVAEFTELLDYGAVGPATRCWAEGMPDGVLVELQRCPFFPALIRGEEDEDEDEDGDEDEHGLADGGEGGASLRLMSASEETAGLARWHYSLCGGDDAGQDPDMSEEVDSSELIAAVLSGAAPEGASVWTEEVGELVPLGEWLQFWLESAEDPPAAADELLQLAFDCPDAARFLGLHDLLSGAAGEDEEEEAEAAAAAAGSATGAEDAVAAAAAAAAAARSTGEGSTGEGSSRRALESIEGLVTAALDRFGGQTGEQPTGAVDEELEDMKADIMQLRLDLAGLPLQFLNEEPTFLDAAPPPPAAGGGSSFAAEECLEELWGVHHNIARLQDGLAGLEDDLATVAMTGGGGSGPAADEFVDELWSINHSIAELERGLSGVEDELEAAEPRWISAESGLEAVEDGVWAAHHATTALGAELVELRDIVVHLEQNLKVVYHPYSYDFSSTDGGGGPPRLPRQSAGPTVAIDQPVPAHRAMPLGPTANAGGGGGPAAGPARPQRPIPRAVRSTGWAPAQTEVPPVILPLPLLLCCAGPESVRGSNRVCASATTLVTTGHGEPAAPGHRAVWGRAGLRRVRRRLFAAPPPCAAQPFSAVPAGSPSWWRSWTRHDPAGCAGPTSPAAARWCAP